MIKTRLCDDKDAQSVTLGFVIIMGIALTTFLILFSTQVPIVTKKFEFEHTQKIEDDFARLGEAIGEIAMSAGRETAFATVSMGMKPRSIPQLGVFSSGGTLEFNSSSEKFECIACSPQELIPAGNGSWHSNFANSSQYSCFHVDIFGEGARLQLETGEDMIFNSGDGVYLSGEYFCNNFIVTNNTSVNTPWLCVHAKYILVDVNSTINATGRGLAGGPTIPEWGTPLSANGTGEGGGKIPTCRHPYSWLDYCYCGAGGGGGGHYGRGGDGGYSWTGSGPYCSGCDNTNHTGGDGGPPYANITNESRDMNTTYPGSGGACGAWGQVACIESDGCYLFEGGAGGDGGGVIILDAPIINISGLVTVDGEDGHYSNDLDRAEDSAGGGGGGGSGGTILIKGGNITITGYLTARGGDGADGAKACDIYYRGDDSSDTYNSNGGGGGGGSGGVIKLFNQSALIGPGGAVMNYTQFREYHTDVSGGAGGRGGIGNGTYCNDSYCPTNPEPGGNGTAGDPGFVYNHSYPDYVESLPHYSAGYLVSPVYDAGVNSPMVCYGNIHWTETKPSGTEIIMKVRTSLYPDMRDALPWQLCPPVTNGADISDLASVSDGHRYLQWRAELYTLERSRTPVLNSVCINYSYCKPVIITTSGGIIFRSAYAYARNFELVYAYGGTIKSQSNGELVLYNPPVSITRDGNITNISITAVDLIGRDNNGSGSCYAVSLSDATTQLLEGGLKHHNLTLNLSTDYPEAWREWFNARCKDAGLEPSAYNISSFYSTSPAGHGSGLSVVFYGNDTHPVRLWLKRTEVRVRVRIGE